jgi:hypothetical protein
MKDFRRLTRDAAPVALLIGPLLYTFDNHSARWGTLGAVCLGVGFSAAYMLLEQIVAELRAKKADQ